MFRPRSLLFLLCAFLASAGPAAAQSQASWIEWTGRGAEIRTTAQGQACPVAKIDGRATPMLPRADADENFPLVCALAVPPGVAALEVAGRALPVPNRAPHRIVMMGDTGCRVHGFEVQACNDPKAWPFAQVARLAAAQKPDLVIHVGDYYYRETACPLSIKACAGSPYGDSWATWAAEFFTPAEPLLRAAPWVFVRGNHEICERGGQGWTNLLDAGDSAADCSNRSNPFAVRLSNLNLYVIDSAQSSDRDVLPWRAEDIARQLDQVGGTDRPSAGWILTHRPAWGLVPIVRFGSLHPIEISINRTLQAGLAGRRLDGVQMVVSGHIHHFSALSFGPKRPAQLIVGTGGDPGESADTPSPYGGQRVIQGLPAQTFAFSRYGYFLFDQVGDGWVGAFHDVDDKVRATCALKGRALSCTALPD